MHKTIYVCTNPVPRLPIKLMVDVTFADTLSPPGESVAGIRFSLWRNVTTLPETNACPIILLGSEGRKNARWLGMSRPENKSIGFLHEMGSGTCICRPHSFIPMVRDLHTTFISFFYARFLFFFFLLFVERGRRSCRMMFGYKRFGGN